MFRIKKRISLLALPLLIALIPLNTSAANTRERTLELGNVAMSTEGAANLHYMDTEEIRFSTDYSDACFVDYLVVKGQYVEEGDIIAEITSNADPAEIREQELKLKRAKEDYSDIETEKTKKTGEAQSYLDKMISWNSDWLIKTAELRLESVNLDYDRRLKKQNEYIAEIQKRLKEMYAARDCTAITAPVSGEIAELESFKRDDILSDDMYIGLIYRTDNFLYRLTDGGNTLHYGMKVTMGDYRGGEYTGEVVSCKSPTLTSAFTDDTVYIKVLDELPEEPPLRMSLKYEIVSYRNVIVLDADECRKDDKGTYVLEVTGEGNIRHYFTPSKTVNGKVVAIDGLEAGMKIISQ